MVQINIFFMPEEDAKIKQYSELWNLGKYETIRKMVRDFEEFEEVEEEESE